jgi:NitT/TauT family transport system substrate-binding protein
MPLRIMASRHSAFYSPLLCAIKFLRDEGQDVVYSVLGAGQRSHVLIRDGVVDIMQSGVSSNWKPRERGVEPLPVHFAQINCRDGFFLAGREPDPAFDWKKLEGKTLLADHGLQPLVMLKYAVQQNGADWTKIKVIDAGTPEKMAAAFSAGEGNYLHLQAPVGTGEIVAAVGASVPMVAFSSLCCARAFLKTAAHRGFLETFTRAREWVRIGPAAEVAAAEASFFPQTASELLTDAITRYQALGCWGGTIEIPRDGYEQALSVFQAAGEITWRHRYDEVVGS